MSDSLFARCGRCIGQCLCAFAIGAMTYLPYYVSIQDGMLPGDFSVPSLMLNATASSTGTSAVNYELYDTMLEQAISVPGPGYHSMQAAVPAEQRPVDPPETSEA